MIYYQNTFLFISSNKANLQPLLRALRFATRHKMERLDTTLIRMGLMANSLRDSKHHLVINYDMYQHHQTGEYILRIKTESEGATHPIDMEYARVYLSTDIFLHYLSEERTQCIYINTDTSQVYLPMRFQVELFINDTYDINYFVTLEALQRFIVATFPKLHISIFDGYKAIRSKINRYIKSLNTDNWCHIATYETKSIHF